MKEKRYCEQCRKELVGRQKRFCSKKCVIKWISQDPEWLMRKKEENQKRAQDPEWLRKNKEIREGMYQDPNWKRKQKEGAQKNAQNPEFLKKCKEAAQKRAQDPEWLMKMKEINQKKAQDPDHQKKLKISAQKRVRNPEYQKKHKEAMQKLGQDPEWLLKHKENMQKTAQDPEWQKKHKEAMQKLGQDPEWLLKHTGENNHQWNNGSSAIPYAPEFICSKVRQNLDKLFNYTCCYCKNRIIKSNIHDHHIDYNKWATGHRDNPFLLVPLCNSCHSKTNGNKKNREKWQKHFMNYLNERFKTQPFFEMVYKRDIMYRNEGKPKIEIPGERYGYFLIKSMVKNNKDHDLHMSFIPPYYSILISSGNEV